MASQKIVKTAVEYGIKPQIDPVYCVCTDIIKEQYDIKYKLLDFSNKHMTVTQRDLKRQLLALNVDVINLVVDDDYNIKKSELITVADFNEINNILNSIKNGDIDAKIYYTLGNPQLGYFKFYYSELLDYLGHNEEIWLPNIYSINNGFLSFNKHVKIIHLSPETKHFSFNSCIDSALTTIDISRSYNEFVETNFNFNDRLPYNAKSDYNLNCESAAIVLNNNVINREQLRNIRRNCKKFSYLETLSQFFDKSQLPDFGNKVESFNDKSIIIGTNDIYTFDIEMRDKKKVLRYLEFKNTSDTRQGAEKLAGKTLAIPPVEQIDRIMNLSEYDRQYSKDAMIQCFEKITIKALNYKVKTLKLPDTLDSCILSTDKLLCFDITIVESAYGRGNHHLSRIDTSIPLFDEIILPDKSKPIIFDSYMDDVMLIHDGKKDKVKNFIYKDFGGIPIKIISIKNIPKKSFSSDILDNKLYKIERAITIATNTNDRTTVDYERFITAVLNKQIYPINAVIYYNGYIKKD